MPPLNALDTWSIRESRTQEEPKAKCFLVGEGANTEFWYLDALATRLAKEGKPELIELKPVKRTGDERNQSHPQKLFEHVRAIRGDRDGNSGFDPDTDRIVVFFDGDIYKDEPAEYLEMYQKLSQVAEVGGCGQKVGHRRCPDGRSACTRKRRSGCSCSPGRTA